jgi:hypothetical protein
LKDANKVFIAYGLLLCLGIYLGHRQPLY